MCEEPMNYEDSILNIRKMLDKFKIMPKRYYDCTNGEMRDMFDAIKHLPRLFDQFDELDDFHKHQYSIVRNNLREAKKILKDERYNYSDMQKEITFLRKQDDRARHVHIEMTESNYNLMKELAQLKEERYYLSEGFRLERKRAKRWAKKQEIECTICHRTMNTEDDRDEEKGSVEPLEWTTLMCDHDFHSVCLNPWLENNNNCPNCRARVSNELLDVSLKALKYLK